MTQYLTKLGKQIYHNYDDNVQVSRTGYIDKKYSDCYRFLIDNIDNIIFLEYGDGETFTEFYIVCETYDRNFRSFDMHNTYMCKPLLYDLLNLINTIVHHMKNLIKLILPKNYINKPYPNIDIIDIKTNEYIWYKSKTLLDLCKESDKVLLT